MSDGDDMNATPLGKLPPPVMQSNKSQPPVEAPSYRDMLQDLESNPRGPTPGPLSQELPQPQSAQVYATQNTYLPPPSPSQYPAQQMQQMPQMPQMAYPSYPSYPPQQPPPQYAPSAGPYQPLPADEPEPAPQGNLLTRVLRSNKSTLLVVAIVLVTLLFVAPRLAKMQRFQTLDGRLNMLGKVVAAVLAGGTFRVAGLVV